MPLKKRHAVARVPMMAPEVPGSPLCIYTLLWHVVERARRAGRGDASPLFLIKGKPPTSSYVRKQVRRAALAAGQNPAEFGGQSPRIGGMTDASNGNISTLTSQLMGRWDGDSWKYYSRACRGQLLSAGAAMHNVFDKVRRARR